MVALSLLSLVASLVVASMNYGGRSRALEANYKRIQQISLKAESVRVDPTQVTRANYEEILKDYSIALESSENHTDGDYALAAKSSGVDKIPAWLDRTKTFIPYLATVLPILILIPFISWLIHGT